MTSDAFIGSELVSRQKKVGDALRRDTRERLLVAAAAEFDAHRYTNTTVTGLAAAAGVSVQTLYSAWGSKRALFRGYLERALAGDAASPEDAVTRFVGLSPRAIMVELAAFVAEVAGRAGTGWSLYRNAAATDEEIAADWNDLQLLRHKFFTRVLSTILDTALVSGATAKTMVDTAWVIASPDSYDLLVNRLGYTLDDFHTWMEQTFTAAILQPRITSPDAARTATDQ